MPNTTLHDSSRNRHDEFYTSPRLMEYELKHCRHHFKNKRLFCNCDAPCESNSFKYFAMNFNTLKLKSLTAAGYAASPVAQMGPGSFEDRQSRVGGENNLHKRPHKIIIAEAEDENGDGRIDLADVELLILNKKNVLTKPVGDGDFRSDEYVALPAECDIVATPPPFSLFREYIAILAQHHKRFLIIANLNAVTYKEALSPIMPNRIWPDYKSGHSGLKFPRNTVKRRPISGRMGNICRFTNLDMDKRYKKNASPGKIYFGRISRMRCHGYFKKTLAFRAIIMASWAFP